ncbi:hypothetical protein EPUS_06833 [Endocarpon pusillum Z07020]|uniref:ubiquitinyl hydrolase 1 n=1 Tax=Endocarpon pusillum (strain Z07020 / HMAS-L-300199) TaxID=1263415 RepID=U1GI13_ENDPU|nr:uncharacterized protein EPUS_06833 [Endocarpon pusillum Z07020]ERF71451.1 hypothetical protein EPUS_06833 [Endocarpon pusillum Z07020]
MSSRNSIENTWPDDTVIDPSLLDEDRKNEKNSDTSRSRSSRSLTSISGSSGASSGKSGSGFGGPTAGTENREISPEEISGEAPAAPEMSPEPRGIIDQASHQYADTSVTPMGFMNGVAPRYASSICYRNAAITMLLNLPCFTNWLSGAYSTRREGGPSHPLMDAMTELAATYWSQPTAKGSARPAVRAKRHQLDTAMDGFWKRFLKASPGFTPKPTQTNFYCQEDSALFLSTLLECVYDELDPISVHGKILGGMFRAWHATSTYCSAKCQKKRKRKSEDGQPVLNPPNWIHIVNFLSPKIRHKGARSFQECFDASLEQQQEADCPRCGRLTTRSAKDKFIILPKILLTQLNRSTNTQGKIQEHCEIPRELTVAIDESARSKYKDAKYRLAAVVAHSGESSTSGHYISYVRDPARTGSWIQLDDDRVRRIDFAEINHNRESIMEDMLPFMMAWELIDLPKEPAASGEEAEAANRKEAEARKQQLDEREAALDTRQEKLNEREKALRVREGELEGGKNRLKTMAADFFRNRNEKQQALAEREADIERREQRLQVEKETAFAQPAAQARDQVAHEVDEGKDTATFCATFRNAAHHDENARAIFKLRDFNPDVPTKIESTVQLTDLEGNLRSVKKGTAVNDDYIIIFNVKGGKKRKRGDDDQAGPPPPPPKKAKRPAKQDNRLRTPPQENEGPQTSPPGKNKSPGAKKLKTSPKSNEKPKSPKTTEAISKKSPPAPRRSARVNKGKNSKRA